MSLPSHTIEIHSHMQAIILIPVQVPGNMSLYKTGIISQVDLN